jgi:hypothetical protein
MASNLSLNRPNLQPGKQVSGEARSHRENKTKNKNPESAEVTESAEGYFNT